LPPGDALQVSGLQGRQEEVSAELGEEPAGTEERPAGGDGLVGIVEHRRYEIAALAGADHEGPAVVPALAHHVNGILRLQSRKLARRPVAARPERTGFRL